MKAGATFARGEMSYAEFATYSAKWLIAFLFCAFGGIDKPQIGALLLPTIIVNWVLLIGSAKRASADKDGDSSR